MMSFKHSPSGATGITIFDDLDLVLDTTARPIRVKAGVNLAPLIVDYGLGRDLAVYDDAGIKVVWTEDGQTHIDEAGDLEVFE